MSHSLYIHFPWCVQKCPYCDFNSHALRDKKLPETNYIDRLIEEFDYHLTHTIQPTPLKSLFLGGGTPSLFSPKSIKQLLDHILNKTNTPTDTEITLEANPGTITNNLLPGFLEAGVNRLSIGVQSFNPNHLKQLGRIHNPAQAENAINAAHQAGFQHINADIMFALPNQTINEALDDLKTALSLPITHLSWYQLTLEPNTAFFNNPPPLPNDDYAYSIQEEGIALIQSHGLNRYEISAYSKNNTPCKHNLNYWQYGDYLGIGAGAHSKLTGKNTEIIRLNNTKHPKLYTRGPIENQITKTTTKKEDKALEYFMNTSRLMQPNTHQDFFKKTGLTIDDIKPALEEAQHLGLMEHTNEQFTVTTKGHQYLNELLALFLNEK